MSFISRFFEITYFRWALPALRQAYTGQLNREQLLELAHDYNPDICFQTLTSQYTAYQNLRRPLLRALAKTYQRSLVLIAMLCVLNVAASIIAPVLLRALIHSIEHYHSPYAIQPYIIVGLLFLTSIAASLLIHQVFFQCLVLLLKIRSALAQMIFTKLLRTSLSGLQSYSSGHIINLLSSDSYKISVAANFIFAIFLYPLLLLCVIGSLWLLLGKACLYGISIMGISMLLATWNSRSQIRLRQKLMKITDSRIAQISQLLTHIRVIKFYAWEDWCSRQILKIRESEILYLSKLTRVQAFGNLIFGCTPILVAVATFGSLALHQQHLEPATVFASLFLFSILRGALAFLPESIGSYLEANASIARIETFLHSPEYRDISKLLEPKGSIIFKDAHFCWHSSSAALESINLHINDGELVCIVGSVGSGKTALLQAILGELKLTSGEAKIAGKRAYVSQSPWIINDSIAANITLADAANANKLTSVLQATALEADVKSFPCAEKSEIGERGINLSGGQKQRLDLARSAYHNADIYLFDDCLSALDPTVGQHVFGEIVLKLLKDKTRILVTHRLEYSLSADQVLVVDQGKIVEHGSPNELKQHSGFYSRLLQHAQLQPKVNSSIAEQPMVTHLASDTLPESSTAISTIVVDEERNLGRIEKKFYQTYLLIFAPINISLIIALLYISKEASAVGADALLAWWRDLQEAGSNFLFGYLSLALLACALFSTRIFVFTWRGLVSGRAFHQRLFNGVIRAPLSFFEQNPVGRILNRFSRDIESIDNVLPRMLQECLASFMAVFTTVVVVVVVSPWTLILLLPLAFLFYRVQDFYRPASRDAQRWEAITRSPLFTQLTEAIQGVVNIRSLKLEDFLVKRFQTAQGFNSRANLTVIGCNRWLGSRIESIGAGILLVAGLFCVISSSYISVAVVALGLSYAMSVSGSLNWAIRSMSLLEGNMNSVERVEYFGALQPERWEGNQVSGSWPSRGEIKISSLSARYRADLPLALDNLSFEIHAGEKIGVIGRTGAGKSSLLLCLFRLIEPCSGTVYIDGIDICQLNLSQLRSSLSIIPQDPVLLSGSLRANLDPYNLSTDQQIHEVLEQIGLSTLVLSRGGLDLEVQDHGSNFSLGQRQLLCLGRVLLKRGKVLLLDEPTASMDPSTDTIMQRILKERFKDSTVLTIAHRISSIQDSDRVLVLDQGKVKQFDTPQKISQLKHWFENCNDS